MASIIVKMIVWFVHSETAKQIAVKIIAWVVNKTSNTIDDRVANELLGAIVKSKGISVTDAMIKDAKAALKKL